ncbi:MAG: hypothetical protein IIW86_05355 [Clostridia bacterium]|nr:hypothetical protein [Clostridia bacterium]
MTAYVPTYDHGRKITAIDTNKARRLSDNSILYNGRIYGGDAFTTHEAAARYWQRERIDRSEYAAI